MIRKALVIFCWLLLLIIVTLGLISSKHPILLKWLEGTAGDLGKPVNAMVYTDGKINKTIKVYHTNKYWDTHEEANNYIISLKGYDSLGMLKFFNINLKEKWIGRPVATSIDNYDFIGDHLFQSETGGHFTPFQDDMKGFNLDPQLTFTEKQIKFNLPPKRLKFDSVRIELK